MEFFPVITSTGYTGKYNVLFELSAKEVGKNSRISCLFLFFFH